MKNQLQINGSYKLTTALLGAVVIVAVLTGIFARSMAATAATESATATPAPVEGADDRDNAGDSPVDKGTEAPTEADFTDDLPETCGKGSADECSFQAGNVALLTSGATVDFNETTGVADVEGSVTIPTNGVDVEIENGDLVIEVDDSGEIVDVSGTSDVPLPNPSTPGLGLVNLACSSHEPFRRSNTYAAPSFGEPIRARSPRKETDCPNERAPVSFATCAQTGWNGKRR